MTPDRLEIARRLAACRRWQWLPGMAFRVAGELWRVLGTGDRCVVAACAGRPIAVVSTEAPMIPDLYDDLTRLGALEVVRAAWGTRAESTWSPGAAPFVVHVPHRGVFTSSTSEEAALLAALEAAP